MVQRKCEMVVSGVLAAWTGKKVDELSKKVHMLNMLQLILSSCKMDIGLIADFPVSIFFRRTLVSDGIYVKKFYMNICGDRIADNGHYQ